jgi:hypothetical protein
VEMDIVVWFTFDQLYTLRLEGSPKILKRLMEEPREQKQARTLIKSLCSDQRRNV